MLLKLVLPPVQGGTDSVVIDTVGVAPGAALRAGARLLELTTGAGDTSAHDCPPVTTYRMTLSETAWLRELRVSAGDEAAPGDVLALLTTTPDEPLGGEPERQARVALAAILKPLAW